MNVDMNTVSEIESQIAGATGAARQTYLARLETELKRLESEGTLSACQVRARIDSWKDDTADDIFDNMPV